MVNRKKIVLYQSDSSLAKTGFGRNTKEVLSYLHSTGKYDIVEYCCSKSWSNDVEHKRKPWRSFGTLPDNPHEMQMIAPNEPMQRMVAYGMHNLDKVVKEVKPDVYIAVQDIWGIDFAVDKPWFDKVTSVLWTTLDSLPLIKSAIDIAPKVKNYWVWSSFAEKAFKKIGINHIKTVHGAIDTSIFRPLDAKKKATLREANKIEQDSFIVGFVFRNQPRKSVPQTLKGFKEFTKSNPHIKNPKLLFHTHWKEGWRIHDLAKDAGVDKKDILTTHFCSVCKSYHVAEYVGENIKCNVCGNEKSVVTPSVGNGISEEQLNEIYNLMDVYLHAFNSGGQELPIQEAKLAGLPTLVTYYSCGEESGDRETGSIPLEWAEYFEPESNFIKASTFPSSISKQLSRVANMSPKERSKLGEIGRKWVIDNFSKEHVGRIIEKLIDDAPFIESDDVFEGHVNNPNPIAPIDGSLSNEEWVLELHNKILGRKTDKYDSSVRNWMEFLKQNNDRNGIERHFRQLAASETELANKKSLFKKIENDKCKKILYVMPASERDIFLSSSLFASIKLQYPDYKLYVATNEAYFDILRGNQYVDEIIPYYQEMDNLTFLEGSGDNPTYFDIAFLPHLHTQRNISYIHNGLTKIAYQTAL